MPSIRQREQGWHPNRRWNYPDSNEVSKWSRACVLDSGRDIDKHQQLEDAVKWHRHQSCSQRCEAAAGRARFTSGEPRFLNAREGVVMLRGLRINDLGNAARYTPDCENIIVTIRMVRNVTGAVRSLTQSIDRLSLTYSHNPARPPDVHHWHRFRRKLTPCMKSSVQCSP